jgi:hypothetical protein
MIKSHVRFALWLRAGAALIRQRPYPIQTTETILLFYHRTFQNSKPYAVLFYCLLISGVERRPGKLHLRRHQAAEPVHHLLIPTARWCVMAARQGGASALHAPVLLFTVIFLCPLYKQFRGVPVHLEPTSSTIIKRGEMKKGHGRGEN